MSKGTRCILASLHINYWQKALFTMTLVSVIYQCLSPFRQPNTSSSKVKITVLASQRNVQALHRQGEGLVCGVFLQQAVRVHYFLSCS